MTTTTGALLRVLSLVVGFIVTSVQAQSSLRALYGVHPSDWPAAQTADGRPAEPLAPLPAPDPMPSRASVALGKRLFHDPRLSRDNSVSCASCHEPRLAFTDKRRFAVGIDGQQGKRNTPAIFGIDQWRSFFWDGRADTAQQQALMPIVDHKEMDASLPKVVARLKRDAHYPKQFKDAFGDDATISAALLAEAIVAFERTLRPPKNTFGTFITKAYRQPDEAIQLLTDQQLQGLHLFRTKAKCMTCHQGPLMSDNQFHVTGFHYYQRKYQDLGRYNVTGNADDSGAFRTPSLWGVSQTAPFFHNGLGGGGSFTGLINQYNHGGPRPKRKPHQLNDPLFPETSSLLLELHLSKEEREALAAFLRTL